MDTAYIREKRLKSFSGEGVSFSHSFFLADLVLFLCDFHHICFEEKRRKKNTIHVTICRQCQHKPARVWLRSDHNVASGLHTGNKCRTLYVIWHYRYPDIMRPLVRAASLSPINEFGLVRTSRRRKPAKRQTRYLHNGKLYPLDSPITKNLRHLNHCGRCQTKKKGPVKIHRNRELQFNRYKNRTDRMIRVSIYSYQHLKRWWLIHIRLVRK